MECVKCGSSRRLIETRHDVHETVAGVHFVVDQPVRRCRECGELYRTLSTISDHELAIAVDLARRGIRKGEAVRYMRRALGMRASDLAELLYVTPDTVGRWERDVVAIDCATFAVLGALVYERRRGGEKTMLLQLAAMRKPRVPRKPVQVIAG